MNKATYKQFSSSIRRYGRTKGIAVCPIYLDSNELQQLYKLSVQKRDHLQWRTLLAEQGEPLHDRLVITTNLRFTHCGKWV